MQKWFLYDGATNAISLYSIVIFLIIQYLQQGRVIALDSGEILDDLA